MEEAQNLHREASQSRSSVDAEPKQEPVSTATPLLHLSDGTLAPQGWPTAPSHIKHPPSEILLNVAFDMALFAFSGCFLVFSLVVMSYNGEPISENPTATSVLTRAAKYGPTVFPLLFASVVGRATHALLLWRLEKGERIQVLDTLATSTSLTSTVTSQIQLRQLSVLSVLLVVTWALSPIGGQASLRQMSIETVSKPNDMSFQYVVPYYDENMFNMDAPAYGLFIGAIFGSSSTKASPVDPWGNVKIPKIEHYEKAADPDSNGWFNTSLDNDDLPAYSSFVGIPITGPQSRNATTDYEFQIQTMYLQLTCARADTSTGKSFEDIVPSHADSLTGDKGIMWYSQDDRNRMSVSPETWEPFNFSYAISERGFSSGDGVSDVISCSMKTSYVEVGILCAAKLTCQAVKIRRSQLPQFPPAFTFMDLTGGGDNLYLVFLGFMTSIGGQRNQSATSILNNYLTDAPLMKVPDKVLGVGKLTSKTQIPDEAWSDRFTQLLNSYWACAFGSYTITGRIDDTTSFFWDKNITFVPSKDDTYSDEFPWNYNWTDDDSLRSKVWSTEGKKTEHIEVIIAHKPWAITLSIASLVLIAFSLVPPLVRHFLTTGPDIAMNFSSLATRNNAYVPIPASGTFLLAADRFRLLKDIRLRFADAERKSDVGTLVIAAQDTEKAEYTRVRKGRLYE
jgi:hypothetical protein